MSQRENPQSWTNCVSFREELCHARKEQFLLRRETPTILILMGDKSPKSKQKSQGQKQGKANASAKEKQRVVDSKHAVDAAPKKKK